MKTLLHTDVCRHRRSPRVPESGSKPTENSQTNNRRRLKTRSHLQNQTMEIICKKSLQKVQRSVNPQQQLQWYAIEK